MMKLITQNGPPKGTYVAEDFRGSIETDQTRNAVKPTQVRVAVTGEITLCLRNNKEISSSIYPSISFGFRGYLPQGMENLTKPKSCNANLQEATSQSQPPSVRFPPFPSSTNPMSLQKQDCPSASSNPTPSPTSSARSMESDSATSLQSMNYSSDIKSMPEMPPRSRGHRRAQSEIAVRLPDDIIDLGEVLGAHPSEEVEDDLFSMYVDIDKFSGAVAGSSGSTASQTLGPQPSVHHSRSLSMDGGLFGVHQPSNEEKPRIRHQHSQSMDGGSSISSIRPEQLVSSNMEKSLAETKKAMSAAKLADLALVDPKRAKRIWANRQSAARSKERKMRYISELERKVQTLQTEATTLSAQLTMLQRDTSGLTNENTELKLRLQSMEQQVHLRDALNDALREEVQRLKLATGQATTNNGHLVNFSTSSFPSAPPLFQFPQQSSHALMAAQQLQQLHLQSQQSMLDLRNGGGSSQGLKDSLAEYNMSDGMLVSSSSEAGCSF